MTAGRALRRSARGIALIAALAGVASGCAGIMGKRAAQGAVKAIEQQASADPTHQIARVAAERAVEGAVSALEEPAQRAIIQRLVNDAVSAAATLAVEKAAQQMLAELGPDGDGPLAVSLSRTGARVSAAAVVGGVGAEIAQLAPECVGPDQLGCLERRLQQTARLTASSFTAGVKDTAGWQLLLVAFVLGAGGGLLGAWLWSLRHFRRRSLQMVES